MRLPIILPCLVLFAVTGCTTIRSSDPQRTATEELLISTAADRAAQNLALNIPKGNRIFVDATDFEGTDSKYAIGSIRDHLLQQGLLMSNDKNNCDTIVEIRSGALSVDERSTLVGVPQLSVPVPLTGTVTMPEIALYKREVQQGVAKFAATSYDAKKGTFISSSTPKATDSYRKQTTVFFFITWTKDDLNRPEER
jgi:hypothetical protein